MLLAKSPSPYELPPPLLRVPRPTSEPLTESLPLTRPHLPVPPLTPDPQHVEVTLPLPATETKPVYPNADGPYSDDDSSFNSDAHEPSPPFPPLPNGSNKLKQGLPSRTKPDSAHPDSAPPNDANSEDILADVPGTVYVPLIQTEWPPVVYAAYPLESDLREARKVPEGNPGESGEIREGAEYDADDEDECLSEEGEEVVYLHPALMTGLGLAEVEDEENGEGGENGR